MRRRLKNEKETCFIMRQEDGKKSSINFLDIGNKKKYAASKMGMLNNVINSFNKRYEGICKLDFQEKEVVNRVDYKSSEKNKNMKRVKNILEGTEVHVVDQIGDNSSAGFTKKVVDFLQEHYGINATAGKRVSRDKLNIVIIHNAEYYKGQKDPHNKKYEDVAVQHITIEDLKDLGKSAVKSVIHEVIIKRDLVQKKISLFQWSSLGFNEPVSFGIEANIADINRYFFMTINPDGTFSIKEQEMSLFELNEYTELVDIFEDGRTESTAVKGVIKFEDGSINVIKDSDMFTVPEIAKTAEYLNAGNTKLRNKEKRAVK